MKKKIKKSVDKVDGFFKEFKDFALKKNIVDLAIAVVIGGAFGKIVTSLVNDIIMPLISLLLGSENFTDLKVVLRQGTESVSQITLNYGAFIQTLMDFFIIAFCIFIAIKIAMRARKAFEKMVEKIEGKESKIELVEEKPVEAKLTKDQELLTEIVTILKEKKTNKNEK